jgi:predicted metalloprotease with PDZ domain
MDDRDERRVLIDIHDTLVEILDEMRKPNEMTPEQWQAIFETTRDQRVADMVQASVMARAVPKVPESKQ